VGARWGAIGGISITAGRASRILEMKGGLVSQITQRDYAMATNSTVLGSCNLPVLSSVIGCRIADGPKILACHCSII
jgi:hypothetical protein